MGEQTSRVGDDFAVHVNDQPCHIRLVTRDGSPPPSISGSTFGALVAEVDFWGLETSVEEEIGGEDVDVRTKPMIPPVITPTRAHSQQMMNGEGHA